MYDLLDFVKYAAKYSCFLNFVVYFMKVYIVHMGVQTLFRIELSPCREGLGQVLTLEPIKEVSMTTGTKMGTQHISGSTCVNSPTSTLANNFAASLSLKSPVAHLSNRKKPEKRLQSAMHLRSTHCGLNSVLPVMNLGTKAAKIRRQSLRTFYGNSVHSPNLMTAVPTAVITVRRSPRFQGNAYREGGFALAIVITAILRQVPPWS